MRELLLDSPNFLWVTRGAPVWGREAALKRFESLYQGTWKLSPDMSNLKTVLVSETTAQLYVPITFNIGAPGQPAPDMPFLMNQTLVKTAAGWRIANILPIPLPHPPPRRRNDASTGALSEERGLSPPIPIQRSRSGFARQSCQGMSRPGKTTAVNGHEIWSQLLTAA